MSTFGAGRIWASICTIACALLLAVPLGAQTPLATVALLADAWVEGDTVYLGDIAKIDAASESLRLELERLYVGRAAPPGSARSVTLGTVQMRMRQARLPGGEILLIAARQATRVSTAGIRVGAEALHEAVRDWYLRLGAVPETAQLVLEVDAREFVAPVGDLEFRISSRSPAWGAYTVPVEVYHNQRFWRRVNVSVRAGVVQLAPVTVRTFQRGEVVHPEDVTYVETELARPLEPWLVPGEIRAVRFIGEGAVLTERSVERMPDVARGESVLVAAKVGKVIVEIAGIADQDGFVGEEMAVLNPSSGKRLSGTLAPDGTVWVAGL